MPTSFSRILSESDLAEVRKQYLDALEALEDEEDAPGPDGVADVKVEDGR